MPLSGERLRTLRKNRGLSLDQLASKTGISRAYLWKLEKKPAANPSLELMERLAKELDTTVGELAGSIPPAEPASIPDSLKKCQDHYGLTDDDVRDLSRIRFRGGQPGSPDDWYVLYLNLKKAMGADS